MTALALGEGGWEGLVARIVAMNEQCEEFLRSVSPQELSDAIDEADMDSDQKDLLMEWWARVNEDD